MRLSSHRLARGFHIAAVLAAAAALSWWHWEAWSHLQRGYVIEVTARLAASDVIIPGHVVGGDASSSVMHIVFPAWRKAAHWLLWFGAIGAMGVFVFRPARAARAALAVTLAVLAVGAWDVRAYGLAAQTSGWSVSLLLLFAGLTWVQASASRAGGPR